MDTPSVKRVLMAKNIAQRWLKENATAEHCVRVYKSASNNSNLPSWLYLFREGRSKIGSAQPFDFSIRGGMDWLELRSRDKDALFSLNSELEQMGYETTGVW